jgi:hypothetical protein
MQACRVDNYKAVDALCALLSQQQSSQVNLRHYLQQHKTKSTSTTNCSNGSTPLSLRVLHLDNPRGQEQQACTSSVSVEQLQRIAEQVVNNYHLEELKIDHYGEPIVATTTFATTFHHGAETPMGDAQRNVNLLSAVDIWRNMDFYFQLNQAGRRILMLPQQPPPPPRQRKTGTTTTTPIRAGLPTGGKNNNFAQNDHDDDGNYNADWYSALATAGSDKKKTNTDANAGDASYSHNSLELLYWMVRHSADRFGHLRSQSRPS